MNGAAWFLVGVLFGSGMGVALVSHIIGTGKFNKRKTKAQSKGIELSKNK